MGAQRPGSSTRKLATSVAQNADNDGDDSHHAEQEHAIISTFDLFSIGIGPSSSHTVGPMRAGNIFITDLQASGLLKRVNRIRIALYGSLALTGEGHMTPSALLLGLEGGDVESVDTAYVPQRFEEIKATKKLRLSTVGTECAPQEIEFDYSRDFIWEWGRKLPMHSNGMRISVFDVNGDILATNDLFSVGGGFVVNGKLSTASSGQGDTLAGSDHPVDLAENMYYKEINREEARGDRKTGSSDSWDQPAAADAIDDPLVPQISPGASIESRAFNDTSNNSQAPYHFPNATRLLALCKQHNLTIAQLMYENEKAYGLTDNEIFEKLFRIWEVMDESIREGVQAPLNTTLPGSLKLRRRAPQLYQRLNRGLYPETLKPSTPAPQLAEPSTQAAIGGTTEQSTAVANVSTPIRRLRRRLPHEAPRIHGSPMHPVSVSPVRNSTLPAMDYLTVYAIAVNETNAAGGRVVTAPTNGAAGIIPAVLKYVVEFVSDDPERDIPIFLLTAGAIASLYKRGATISAAEGGCMAEVGVACSMAAGAYAACMGAGPESIEQAAEIGIEHNLGLTCDPVGGLVQAPCIERNALGAIKAVSSANLALSSTAGQQKVSLDDAIRAMRLTAKGMKDEFKETSLSGLATTVPFNIPVSVPDC
jgi:L-serine deaminase